MSAHEGQLLDEGQALAARDHQTVFEAYNEATDFAMHRMRSARTAFELLARINEGFQEVFSPS
jgi:hypothetical protein